jgi:hypothetical protein
LGYARDNAVSDSSLVTFTPGLNVLEVAIFFSKSVQVARPPQTGPSSTNHDDEGGVDSHEDASTCPAFLRMLRKERERIERS